MSEIAAGASASSFETNSPFETEELFVEGSFESAETDATNEQPLEKETTFFSDLGLPEIILQTLEEMGFTEPTPIQRQGIPPLMAGRDVVGIAQTGTGKTAAFGLPILSACEETGQVQALILAPTRELAAQSATALTEFSQGMTLKIVAVYGGASYGPQISALRDGAQIVVGTPGRIMDLMERGELDLSALKFFVLDEADEMLRMGFSEDVDQIASGANPEAIRALFSATMPPAIKRIAERHLSDPVEISIAPQSSTVETVNQTYAVVPFKFKSEALVRVLALSEASAAIVFVRTRIDAEQLGSELQKAGFLAAAISGDVPQAERERIVARLRDGGLDVLVATDVAARGLDVERIGLVVNYDVPREAEAYVHRIGRTGRAGREGTSLTFFTPRERPRKGVIEKLTGQKMTEVFIPSPAQVAQARAGRMAKRVQSRLEKGEMDVYYDAIQDLVVSEGIDIGDAAASLLALASGDFGPEKRQLDFRVRREEKVDELGRFISASFEEGREGTSKKGTRAKGAARRHFSSPSARRYRIEVGRRDRVKPGAIVGAITGEGGLKGGDVGHIDILQSFSLVELARPLSPETIRKIAKARVSGRTLRIREDEGPGKKTGKKRDFKGKRRG
ncbi:DEAD/DEAH box helicase [Varibaculum vaginae]|uniref:DEAD/DEAH box helicase n=1 Tax=Varibaculum vaginae TaxID=2364797 RepID=UPI000F08EE1D|nr:DEAD/DEAH box helicase [Varibaculum vaginae]